MNRDAHAQINWNKVPKSVLVTVMKGLIADVPGLLRAIHCQLDLHTLKLIARRIHRLQKMGAEAQEKDDRRLRHDLLKMEISEQRKFHNLHEKIRKRTEDQ